MIGKASLERGYSVLIYEGPGQGEPLRKYGLKFTPEWEKPTTAVLDEFLRTHDKPSKILFFGMSMGGYLAPRPQRSKNASTALWHTTCVLIFMSLQSGSCPE